MNITLYQNLSEFNVVSKNLINPIEVTGFLREPTSIQNPTLTIKIESSNIVWVNYIYIAEWNRYYFVGSITSIHTGLWQIDCHVDVLMTYKDYLMNQSGIIARQENLYNLYLDDEKFLVNAQRMVVSKAFPNKVTSGGRSFILTIASGSDAPPSGE